MVGIARGGVWSRRKRQGGVPPQQLGAPRPLGASSLESLPHHPRAPSQLGCGGEHRGKPEPRAGGARAGIGSGGRGLSQEAPRFAPALPHQWLRRLGSREVTCWRKVTWKGKDERKGEKRTIKQTTFPPPCITTPSPRPPGCKIKVKAGEVERGVSLCWRPGENSGNLRQQSVSRSLSTFLSLGRR